MQELASETILEPMTETNVVGKVEKPNDKILGVLEPTSFKNGSHAGAVLVHIKERVPVRVVNPTSEKIKLSAGTHLGKLVEVLEHVNDFEVGATEMILQ